MIARRATQIGSVEKLRAHALSILEKPNGNRMCARRALQTGFSTDIKNGVNLFTDLDDGLYMFKLRELKARLDLPVCRNATKRDIYTALLAFCVDANKVLQTDAQPIVIIDELSQTDVAKLCRLKLALFPRGKIIPTHWNRPAFIRNDGSLMCNNGAVINGKFAALCCHTRNSFSATNEQNEVVAVDNDTFSISNCYEHPCRMCTQYGLFERNWICQVVVDNVTLSLREDNTFHIETSLSPGQTAEGTFPCGYSSIPVCFIYSWGFVYHVVERGFIEVDTIHNTMRIAHDPSRLCVKFANSFSTTVCLFDNGSIGQIDMVQEGFSIRMLETKFKVIDILQIDSECYLLFEDDSIMKHSSFVDMGVGVLSESKTLISYFTHRFSRHQDSL